MRIRMRHAWTFLIFSGLIGIAPLSLARDRPGTPTDVFAGVYKTPMESLPQVLLSFRNTASERVSFWLEWTENGVRMPDDIGGRLGCPSASAQQYYCHQTTFYRHPRVQGRALTTHREFPHAVLFNNLKFESDYCFRLLARDEDGVISEMWSAWACTRTPPSPPMPKAPVQAQLTFLPGSSGRGSVGLAVPPRALIEWKSQDRGSVAWFVVEEWTARWQSDVQGRGTVRVGGTEIPSELQVTVNLRAEVDPQKNAPRFRVCSINVAGSACTVAVAGRLLQTATAASPIGGARAAAETIAPKSEVAPAASSGTARTTTAAGSTGAGSASTPLASSAPSAATATASAVRGATTEEKQAQQRHVTELERDARKIQKQAEEAADDASKARPPASGWLEPAPATLNERAGTRLYERKTTPLQTSGGSRGATPLQQAPVAKIPPELAAEAGGKELVEMRCRGGGAFNFHKIVADPAAERLRARGSPERFMLSFLPPKKNAAGNSPPAGEDGGNLEASQCSFADREFTLGEPVGIVFDVAPERSDIQEYLEDPTHFWAFTAFKTNYGHFRAVQHAPWMPAGAVTDTRGAIPSNLFELDDRAKIVVHGKEMTAGQLKGELRAQLRRESGAPRPVTTARRSTATPIAGTASATATIDRYAAPAAVSAPSVQQTQVATVRSASSGGPVLQQSHNQPIASTATNNLLSSSRLQVDCTGQAPRVLQVRGDVRPSQPFTIEGSCLGREHGTIELSGLPTGKLNAAFTSWTENSIAVLMPAVSGVQDQRLTLTIIRNPDRKTSPPREIAFEAARELVAVSADRWSPSARFQQQALHESDDGSTGPMRQGGTYQARVQVHPACTLDAMSANPGSGAVSAIRGWDSGPPHQSDVALDWKPKCIIRRETTPALGENASPVATFCEIDFTVSATAHCPAGIKP